MTFVYKLFPLTSHEEEKSCHILHKASIPAAPQHPNNPSKEDDGYSHAHETCCHSAQICKKRKRGQSVKKKERTGGPFCVSVKILVCMDHQQVAEKKIHTYDIPVLIHWSVAVGSKE